jgi:hypothetical protein
MNKSIFFFIPITALIIGFFTWYGTCQMIIADLDHITEVMQRIYETTGSRSTEIYISLNHDKGVMLEQFHSMC